VATGLLLFVAFFAAAMVFAFAAILVGIPLGALFGDFGGPGMPVYDVFLGLLAAVIGALAMAFAMAVWTLVYRQLGGTTAASAGSDLLSGA
jgi:hypothetical protein